MNKTLTPLKAIRQHCLVCAGRPKDVRECPSTECSLHAYRMGHNPARKGVGPSEVYARSISKGILSNSGRVPEEIMLKRCSAMSKERSLNQLERVASGGEIGIVKMKAVGNVQVLDKKIIIEW